MKYLFLVILFFILSGCSSFINYGGVKYEYVMKSVSWTEAENLAEKGGDRLAIFSTPEDLANVEAKLPRGKIFWVGLIYSEKEGAWKWLDGSPLNPEMPGMLERGGNSNGRHYGYILLQGGLGSRVNTGALPRGLHGRKQVDGYLVEFRKPVKDSV